MKKRTLVKFFNYCALCTASGVLGSGAIMSVPVSLPLALGFGGVSFYIYLRANQTLYGSLFTRDVKPK